MCTEITEVQLIYFFFVFCWVGNIQDDNSKNIEYIYRFEYSLLEIIYEVTWVFQAHREAHEVVSDAQSQELICRDGRMSHVTPAQRYPLTILVSGGGSQVCRQCILLTSDNSDNTQP